MAKTDADADAPVKRGRGRPTKFTRAYLEAIFDLALLGKTEPEMAEALGVTRQTLNNWRKTQPGFFDACTRGKEIADARVARSLYERALGYSHSEIVITTYQGEVTKTRVTKHYPPDTNAASLWLRNRQPARWRAQPDPADGTDAPPPVSVTVKVEDGRRTSP